MCFLRPYGPMINGCCKMIPGPLSMLLLVICNSVKMGIHLCYKWDKPKSMVKVPQP